MDNYTPFAYFRELLNEKIYIALDAFNFYSDPVDFITLGNCSKTGKPILLGKILSIDNEKHIIEYVDCGEQKTKSLHNDLKKELSSETKRTIQFIENEYLKCSNNQEKDNLHKYLNLGFTSLETTKGYGEFYFLSKYLEQIEEIINLYFTENNTTEYINSSFSVKSTVKLSVFSDLYIIAEENGVIDYEKISEDTFIKTLTGKNDDNSFIKFSCTNSMMIQFLLDIKPLFNNFKAKDIQQSKKLITKGGSLITIQTYDTAKKRLKLNSEISMMSEKIKTLLQKV